MPIRLERRPRWAPTGTVGWIGTSSRRRSAASRRHSPTWSTELAGYSGKRLDLQLPAEQPCNYYVFAEPKGLYANGTSNRWRVWLLDVDGSTAVVVLLDYAGTSAEDRAAAQAAIDSIRITP